MITKISITIFTFFICWVVLSAQDEPAKLEIGYSASTFFDINIDDGRAATEILTRKLATKMGLAIKTETIIFHDIAAIEKAIQEQRLDLIGLLPNEFLEVSERVPLQPVVIPLHRNRSADEFLLLARRDSGIKQLSELKNKRIIIETRGRGGIPLIWLNTLLMKQSLPESNDFFSEVKEANKASQTVLPVFFRQADACIVGRILFEITTELNPQLNEDLMELARSPGFCFGLIACREDFVQNYPGDLTKNLLELHQDIQGKQLLTLFRIDRLVPFTAECLNSIKELRKEYQNLRIKSQQN